MSEFTHQVCFRQPVGCKGEGSVTARWLSKEAASIGIEAYFEHLVAQVCAQIVVGFLGSDHSRVQRDLFHEQMCS